jgi:3-oxoacyl-(acyl-carrier-protein) synthase
MSDRIVITGMGCLSAAGRDLPQHIKTLKSGRRSCHAPTLFTAPFESPVFETDDPAHAVSSDEMRVFKLAWQAVSEALQQAGLNTLPSGATPGIFLGTTTACQLNDLDYHRIYYEGKTPPPEPPLRFFRGHLSDRVGLKLGWAPGPRVVVTNACASGTDAIGLALDYLQSGLCDVAIAGGADELSVVSYSGFHSLSVLSPQPCRPFDKNRQGLNLGEGAGVLILEREQAARARGLSPRVFVAGYGAASDAHHMTAPHPDGVGLELAVRTALARAQIETKDIGFINAHGTATPDNDRIEGRTLARIFGMSTPIVSTKGYTGHTLGAAGGLEAVFTALGLDEGWIPTNAGFEEQDPEIPITPPRETTEVQGQYALSTSLAFGGSNAALILGKLSDS